MGWKATGRPTVRAQRDAWVVRVDGIDTASGVKRPRQLGTFPSKRAAQNAAANFAADGDAGVVQRGTVAWLVGRWVTSRTEIGPKTRSQYEWASVHVCKGLGAVTLELLDRDDVAVWLADLAAAGKLSRRSIEICRMLLRAALADAVSEGIVKRNVAARVAMPRMVVKAGMAREIRAWNEDQIETFLAAVDSLEWAVPLRLMVLYGLRRSELLGLHWVDVDLDAGTLRIRGGVVEVNGASVLTDGKNSRSRRVVPIDVDTARRLSSYRVGQLQARLAAGSAWCDTDLVVCDALGGGPSPNAFHQVLERVVSASGLPRLTSHGLRHTAASHMVRDAADIGELRAIADVLGHSPAILMRTYAHALPDSMRAVADRVGLRATKTS